MTKCSKKVSMKWTSLLAQGWTKIPGAQQPFCMPKKIKIDIKFTKKYRSIN